MKDPLMVRMAYRFLLGRDPESKSLLEMEFNSIDALRDTILYSHEFRLIAESVLSAGGVHVETSYLKYLGKNKIMQLSGLLEGDEELLQKYADNDATALAGYYTDFMGVHISPKALPYLHERVDIVSSRLPIPDDAVHAEAIEYCALLQAVENAGKSSFVMLELGAGWGPWMIYAAKACKKRGIENVTVIGVEGEQSKIPLIKEALTINNLRNDHDALIQKYDNIETRIIHGVVAEHDGFADFEIVPEDHYGASLLNAKSDKTKDFTKVPSFTLDVLLRDFDSVDFIHIDIQGYEQRVIESSISTLNKKLRYICVGTHSRKIEGDLIALLSSNNWKLLRETPCLFNKHIQPNSDMLVSNTTLDGVQFWVNCHLNR